MHPEKILQVAVEAARGAAEIILKGAEQVKTVNFKGRADLVTDTDTSTEKFICTKIIDSFPDHGILAEETGTIGKNTEYLWVIDPLDGTTNFVHNYPAFAVSIGVFHQKEPLVGCVIELPAFQIYTALKNYGAYCNEKPIKVSLVDKLENALFVTGFGYEHHELWESNMELFKKFTDIGHGVRRLGAAAVDLCHLASGKVDGYWEYDLHPWDTAAGMLIVQEAGGKVTKMNGEKYSISENEILASNHGLHQQMLDFIHTKL